MAISRDSRSAAVRSRLDHPVIDGDGHWLEPIPIFLDYLRQVAGPAITERYVRLAKGSPWYEMTARERMDKRMQRDTWWGEPGNTLDRATAMIPRLFHERLDDFGVDFAMVYTTLGLLHISHPNEEMRRAVCRALNVMSSEMFGEFAHRMAPVAVVPMYTPSEAIEEAEYAVRELGMKAIMIASHVRRPIPELARDASDVAKVPHYIDSLALDSPYDYDPFWAKCMELKVAVTSHSRSIGWGSRVSVSNFTYNHVGHFAASAEAFCKALVLGGVTRRFPTLNFAFMEGGVGWACNLLTDLLAHWEKRSAEAMAKNLRPTNVDPGALADYFSRYGGERYEARIDALLNCLSFEYPFKSLEELSERENDHELDDFGAANIASAEALRTRFARNFYFGCESDDVMTAWAFDKHGKHRLKPIFSSDVGHFDVTDMTEVLEEAHEMVEDSLISQADFRDFVFTYPAGLHMGMNPEFFKGTVVEAEVAKLTRQAAVEP